MALQSSGAISLQDIATEFGGSTPHSISEYYGVASGVPSSGTIDFADFYGTSAGIPQSGLLMEMDPANYSSGSTWNDSAGTNNDMTKVGSPSYTSTSPEYFTTSDNNHWAVNTRPTGSYGAATMACWIYPTSTSGISGLIDIRYGSGTQFGMEDQGGRLGYFWNNNNSGTWGHNSGVTWSTNAWIFVGISVSSTQIYFFRYNSSGLSSSTRTYTHSSQTIASNSNFYYGGDPESTGRGFNGRVGHMYLYNTALSTSDVASLYNAEKSNYGH